MHAAIDVDDDDDRGMDSGRERAPRMGGGVGGGSAFRNVQAANGNISHGSTLERPAVGRSVVYPTQGAVPAGHLVTTTADVEHHHHHHHQHPARVPDMRSPLPSDPSPFPVFDTNQVLVVPEEDEKIVDSPLNAIRRAYKK